MKTKFSPQSSVLSPQSLRLVLALLSGLWTVDCGLSQTAVLFPLAQMTGTTNDTTITIRPVLNPVKFNSQIYWLPPAGIQLATKNGSATTNLIPNDYNVTIAGVPGSWKISVNDTNVTLNAAEIGNLITYNFINPLPGVFKLIAGNNISLSPPGGQGIVTINATGSGGGGGSATNAYQIQAGNKLISIATNLTDFIYTISGVSQTNGYPWGVLYDAAGAATAATNGLGIASGLAAFRGTNTLAATNAATTSARGLVKADGSTITVATDGTISAVNTGNVSGPASATDGNLPLFDGTTGKLLKDGGVSPASFDAAGSATAATNGYPWGGFYDAAGSATAATNGIGIASGLAAFRGTNTFDVAGAATAATNGYPWGGFYDAAGSATAATNGIGIASGLAAFRGTNTFDVAGAANAATNALGISSGFAAFRGTNTFAPTNVATASSVGLVKVDNATIVVTSDGIISATTGGGGSVTSVALTAPGEFSVAGSPITGSGTLAITRTADANFLGLGATNVSFLKVTNTASIGGQVVMSALVLTNGFTNQALTASTLLQADANKKLSSLANGAGALTNDASGNFGYAPLLNASALGASQYVATDGSTNLVSTQNGNNWTNTIAWTHEGTTTNLTAAFNGTLQSFTVTNGPDVFLGYAGANGSVSYRFTTNVTLHFSYQPKWLTGSNSVITNGVLSLTSYGGTNVVQLEAAMKENQ